VQDYCDTVEMLLNAPAEKIQNEIFNVGYENMSIMEIAHLVKKVVQEEFPDKKNLEIVTTPSDDNRSYHINSDKVKRVLNFQPKHSTEEAIRDLCRAFRDGKLPNSFDDDFYFNVRRLKRLQAV
jgi:nucleoside-diphosphate-sugar epimerase